jgi:transcriptional regulator with XRE-family HTH domain
MSRSPRRLLPSTGGRTQYEKLELERFARKLHEAMTDRGLSQSDLAAEVWGRTTDSRGYDVAKGRDRISVYLQGKSIPDPANLKKIAEVLNMKVEDLAPDITASAVEKENPEIAMTAIAGHHDKVYLRVNKLVPLELAAKTISMLSEKTPQP